MATKLYFSPRAVPPISPAVRGAWETSSQHLKRMMTTQKVATSEELANVDIGADAASNALFYQLVSPPLSGAQTISGTYSLVTKGNEVAASDNVNKRWRGLYVVSEDGSTLRGTLDALAATASTTELTSGGLGAGQQHANAGGLTTVNAQDRDRIIVEVGYGVGTSGTSPQADMWIGGDGADHANANNDAGDTEVPWLELSATLTFDLSATVTPSAIAAVAALPAPTVGVGVAPGTIAAVTTLPLPTEIGQVSGDVTVTPGAIATTVALPQPAVEVGIAPGVVAASVALPAVTVGVGIAPAVIAALASIPAAQVGVGVTPGVIAALAALPQPAVGVGVAPGVIAALCALPLPPSIGQTGDATVAPGSIATVVGLPQPAVGVGVAPSPVGVVVALPQPGVGVTEPAGVIAALVSLPSPILVMSAEVQAGVIAALVALPSVQVGVGVTPGVIALVVTLPEPEFIGEAQQNVNTGQYSIAGPVVQGAFVGEGGVVAGQQVPGQVVIVPVGILGQIR